MSCAIARSVADPLARGATLSAHELLGEAVSLLRDMEMAYWLGAAGAALAPLGPSPRRKAPVPSDGLTTPAR